MYSTPRALSEAGDSQSCWQSLGGPCGTPAAHLSMPFGPFWGGREPFARFWGVQQSLYGVCVEYMWNVCGICMEYVWNMYGIGMEYGWNMYGVCTEYVWNIYGICVE